MKNLQLNMQKLSICLVQGLRGLVRLVQTCASGHLGVLLDSTLNFVASLWNIVHFESSPLHHQITPMIGNSFMWRSYPGSSQNGDGSTVMK
jgi:hypothetical protein